MRAKSAELRAARTTLQALADDTAVADTYKSDYMRIDGGDTGALFLHIDNVNRNVVQRLDDVLSRLKRVLHQSGVELALVANWYDDADDAAHQRSDRQISVVADVPSDGGVDDLPTVPDTAPSNPGDYEPPDDQPSPPLGDGEGTIMAPGPLGVPGQASTSTGGMA